MKKLLSISLATVLCFGLSIPASAAAEDSLPAVNETEIVSTKEIYYIPKCISNDRKVVQLAEQMICNDHCFFCASSRWIRPTP